MHVLLFRHQHTSQQSALYSGGSALKFWMKEWVLTKVACGCFYSFRKMVGHYCKTKWLQFPSTSLQICHSE